MNWRLLMRFMEGFITSLDLESQKVAYEQLNRRRGAVVAVDISTGP